MKSNSIFCVISTYIHIPIISLLGVTIALIVTFVGCISKKKNVLQEPKGLFLDSFQVKKKAFPKENIYIDPSVQSDFAGDAWFLVVSCKVKNATKDSLFWETFAVSKANTVGCVETLLYAQGSNYFIYDSRCFDRINMRFDTFLPNDSKLYFIPFWATPQAHWGEAFYVTFSTNGKVLSKKGYAQRGCYECDTTFRFVAHVNIKTDQVHRVDSTFEQIIERYKAQGGKQVPHPDW